MRKPIPRSLPFSISRPLLNFLGYARERTVDFIDPKIARSMLGQPLERAAVRHGLIEPAIHRIEVATGNAVVPFRPTGAERQGYKLTRHGRLLGEIGKRARGGRLPGTPDWASFIHEATVALNEAIRESNLRVA
jgi:hypothetical protein